MKNFVCTLFLLTTLSIQVVLAQAANKPAKQQYGFIMVMNKEATKFYVSPVFGFQIDKRGDPICDLGETEAAYRLQVADEKYDVLTSDYFDSKKEADQARKFYIASEKKAGRTVIESKTVVEDCN